MPMLRESSLYIFLRSRRLSIQTFKAKRDSDFYKSYFAARNEEKKFIAKAREFFQEYNMFDCVAEYALDESLRIKFKNVSDKVYFDRQLRKEKKDGFYIFKKTSALGKAWADEVVSLIDFEKMHFTRLWCFAYIIRRGRYALWDYAGDVYGMIENDGDERAELGDFLEEIWIGDYYKIQRESEMAEDETDNHCA